jgi:putative N6-adenine-specific DNA methylase
MGKQIRKMIAKTMAGLEDILATELEEIGAAKVQKLNRAVSFEGDLAMMYKANYCCRTALSILVDKFSFKFNSQEDFYRNILNYNWDPLFEHDTTFSVDATISGDIFTNSHYTALLCKDAIVDYFRKKYNQRPTVDRFEPHLKVNVYVRNDECSILLDSSGESLFKRGYRVATGDAPIKEVLAAGIIMLSGWNGETNFYAPMCGSGTFAIEAAMIASKIPAGYYREQFASRTKPMLKSWRWIAKFWLRISTRRWLNSLIAMLKRLNYTRISPSPSPLSKISIFRMKVEPLSLTHLTANVWSWKMWKPTTRKSATR